MKKVIVIPTYNEKENIQEITPLIFRYVPDVHLFVVDDNSPDGTADVVRDLQKKYKNLSLVLRQKKEGLGFAYKHAFDHVLQDKEVETVVMMDADLSHDPKHLPEMFRLRDKYDLVIGSRYVKEGRTEGWELWRRIMSRCGNFYAKNIIGVPFLDCTGGFNAMDSEILRKVDFSKMNLSGYAFIINLKYELHKAGATSTEIPILFKNRTNGQSKLSGKIISEGVIAPWKMRLRK